MPPCAARDSWNHLSRTQRDRGGTRPRRTGSSLATSFRLYTRAVTIDGRQLSGSADHTLCLLYPSGEHHPNLRASVGVVGATSYSPRSVTMPAIAPENAGQRFIGCDLPMTQKSIAAQFSRQVSVRRRASTDRAHLKRCENSRS